MANVTQVSIESRSSAHVLLVSPLGMRYRKDYSHRAGSVPFPSRKGIVMPPIGKQGAQGVLETFGGRRGLFWALAGMLALVGLTVGVLFWLGEDKNRFPDLRASVALPMLLLVGLGSLLLLITLVVAVLNSFGLTDKRHAFGLPDGSMQAIVALALILIFIISSLFLYSSLPDKITPAQIAAARNKHDIAQQLLTTVGTLAVAVAGFYFGTKSVGAAAEAVNAQVGALRLLWPSSPVTLALTAGTTLEPIVVEADRIDRRINVTVTGDDPTSVKELQPGTFQYTRGASPAAKVTIAFSLMDGRARTTLDVLEP